MSAPRVGPAKTPKVETQKKHPGLEAMERFKTLKPDDLKKLAEGEMQRARDANKGWGRP